MMLHAHQTKIEVPINRFRSTFCRSLFYISRGLKQQIYAAHKFNDNYCRSIDIVHTVLAYFYL